MLDKIREKKSSAWSWAITIVIIVVFVAFFGPGSFRKTRKGCGVMAYAAKVEGQTISLDDFKLAYQNRKREMASRTGGKLDYGMEKALNLKQVVLDELVDLEVLNIIASRYGLVVTDDELNKSIMSNPAFQTNGQFDFQLYSKLVRYHYQISLKKYEERQRSRLASMKLVELLRGTIKMSDDELLEDYLAKNNKVDLVFASFDPIAYKTSVAVTQGEIDDLVGKGRDRLEGYFKAHDSDYNTPKKVKASHILLKTSPKSSEGEQSEAKAKAEKIIGELNGGASFEELAKKYSDDPGSKEKGGSLDWFEKGRMVREFEDSAFSLKKGEMTQTPVKSSFGYHIIKVDDIREPVNVDLKEAGPLIARAMLTEEKAQAAAQAAALKALDALKSGKKLTDLYPLEPSGEEAAKKTVPAAIFTRDTGMFAKSGNYIPMIGISKELMDDAFSSTADKPILPRVYTVSGKAIVAVVKDRATADRTAFAKEKDKFEAQDIYPKQATFISDWIKAQREGVKVEINTDLVSYDVQPERERLPDDY
jgi:peptidyl-prolyl cis-trans isomerase D